MSSEEPTSSRAETPAPSAPAATSSASLKSSPGTRSASPTSPTLPMGSARSESAAGSGGSGARGNRLGWVVLLGLVLLAAVGAGASLILTQYSLSGGTGASRLFGLMCDAEEGGCRSVLQSRWATTGRGGMPVSAMGLGYFCMLGVWYLVVGRPNRVGRWWKLVPITMNGVGVLYSAQLAWVMWTEVGEFCGWCGLVHGVNAVMLAMGVAVRPSAGEGEAARPAARLGLAGVLAMGLVWMLCVVTVRAVQLGGTARAAAEYVRRYRDDADLVRYKYERGEKHEIPLRGEEALRGKAGAAHTVVVFSDFECPRCKALAKFIDEELMEAYGEELRVVFRHYPLDSACNANVKWTMHADACALARAAEAARELGGEKAFRTMHDLLFERQGERLSGDRTIALLTEQWHTEGLDGEALAAAMEEGAGRERIAEDIELARRLGVRGTPTVFVDGKRLVEWDRMENWEAVLGGKKQKQQPKQQQRF